MYIVNGAKEPDTTKLTKECYKMSKKVDYKFIDYMNGVSRGLNAYGNALNLMYQVQINKDALYETALNKLIEDSKADEVATEALNAAVKTFGYLSGEPFVYKIIE